MEDIIEKMIGEEIFDERDDKRNVYKLFRMFDIENNE